MASALLTPLVNEIITALNSSPGSTWSDLSVGTGVDDFVKALPCLDPERMFHAPTPKALYVNPVVVDYDRAASQGRHKIVKLIRKPVVAICLVYKFEDQDESGLDVSSWSIVEKLLNLREEIETYLAGLEYSFGITNITAEPPMELPMKSRWLLCITEFEFEGQVCV